MMSHIKSFLLCIHLSLLMYFAAGHCICNCSEAPAGSIVSNFNQGQEEYRGQSFQNSQRTPVPNQGYQRPRTTPKPIDDEFHAIFVQGRATKISKNEKTWVEAQSDCHVMGMKLISLESNTKQNGFAQNFNDGITYDFWTSGSNREQNSRFKWTNTGEFVNDDWSSWDYRQPDNLGGSQHCLKVTFNWNRRLFNTKWFDESCEEKFRFICQ